MDFATTAMVTRLKPLNVKINHLTNHILGLAHVTSFIERGQWPFGHKAVYTSLFGHACVISNVFGGIFDCKSQL